MYTTVDSHYKLGTYLEYQKITMLILKLTYKLINVILLYTSFTYSSVPLQYQTLV